MRPLYLQGRQGAHVRLDGPALDVRMPQRAPTLFPLLRVSRVVVSGPVQWSTEALLACAERGITVTFLDRNGGVRAYLFGESGTRESLFHRLCDLLDRADWAERYGDWKRGMASHARRALCRQLRLDSARLPPERLLATLDELERAYAPAQLCHWLQRRLRGWLAGLVAEVLAEAGLDAARQRTFGDRLHLTDDLVELLAWDLRLPVLELLLDVHRRRADTVALIDEARLLRLVEGRSERLRRLLRRLLARLHGWAIDLD